jgi:hypothetical protein
MKIVKINGKLGTDEREVVLLFDYTSKKWNMDTTVMKYYNKAKKQGWAQIKEYVYDDGTVCGGVFEAPERSVTIRNTEKKQMSEKQMGNLFDNEDEEDED